MFFQVIYAQDNHSQPNMTLIKSNTLEQAIIDFATEYPDYSLIHIDGVDQDMILDVNDPNDYEKLVQQINDEIQDPEARRQALADLVKLTSINND